MRKWLRRWLQKPPKNEPQEEQLELPFDPPLPRLEQTKTNHSSQENL